jgi:hypothetical protein
VRDLPFLLVAQCLSNQLGCCGTHAYCPKQLKLLDVYRVFASLPSLTSVSEAALVFSGLLFISLSFATLRSPDLEIREPSSSQELDQVHSLSP